MYNMLLCVQVWKSSFINCVHAASRATPNVQLQQEQSRLQNDCKRLVAMLETTSEYQHWMGHRAALQGVHYIPIAECLASEGITSDVYIANNDRVVRSP